MVVGKRGGGGSSTPPPTWRLEISPQNGENPFQEFLKFSAGDEVSARKLCANFWENQPYDYLELFEMNKGGARVSHQKDQPVSGSSLRHIDAPQMQLQCSFERSGHTLRPVSPASCSNSMEVTPYKPAVTPTTSLNYKDRVTGSRHSLKTSTELLKLLNRIWSLEQQHASDVALVKALKVKLDHAQAQAKVLVWDKQRDMQEMDYLLKQVEDVKLVRKHKKQDQVKDVEDERKHQKLAQELSEAKSSLSYALKQLKSERKARILLESLCDEFAKGIRDYDQKTRSMKGRNGGENSDQLVLHISEAWLDERIQMKQTETPNDLHENSTIVDKLNVDIATFLKAKQSMTSRKNSSVSRKERKGRNSIQHSSESFPFNDAVSVPNSTDFGSRCNPLEKILKSSSTKEKSGLQGQFDERLPRTLSCKVSKVQFLDREQNEMQGKQRIGIKKLEISLPLEGEKLNSARNSKEDSCVQSVCRGHNASPVQPWMSKLTAPDFRKSEAYLNWPQSTLKAKLLEAKLEGQQSRTKASRSSF